MCDTPVTGDVRGWMNPTDVVQFLQEIMELEPLGAATSGKITFEQIDTLLSEYESLTSEDVSHFIQEWVGKLNAAQ